MNILLQNLSLLRRGRFFCYALPMYEQYLPNYIRNFLSDSRWLSRQSAHYCFFYFPNSIAEREIELIEKRQEQSYKKIIDFLEVPEPKRRIEYYFYPDKKTKKELMGDDWYAQAILNEFRIHMLYTDEHKPIGEHEDTHLLSLPLGQSVGFFNEGLAEYMVGHSWHGENHGQLVIEAMKKEILPTLESVTVQKCWMELNDEYAQYNYAFAGSFVKFLVEKYGKEKFKELFRKTSRQNSKEQNIDAFSKIYGIAISEAETVWKKSLGL